MQTLSACSTFAPGERSGDVSSCDRARLHGALDRTGLHGRDIAASEVDPAMRLSNHGYGRCQIPWPMHHPAALGELVRDPAVAGSVDDFDVRHERPQGGLHSLTVLSTDDRRVRDDAHDESVAVMSALRPGRVDRVLSRRRGGGERLDLPLDPDPELAGHHRILLVNHCAHRRRQLRSDGDVVDGIERQRHHDCTRVNRSPAPGGDGDAVAVVRDGTDGRREAQLSSRFGQHGIDQTPRTSLNAPYSSRLQESLVIPKVRRHGVQQLSGPLLATRVNDAGQRSLQHVSLIGRQIQRINAVLKRLLLDVAVVHDIDVKGQGEPRAGVGEELRQQRLGNTVEIGLGA